MFIEFNLPKGIVDLKQEDHDAYRAPFPTPESRKPMLAWSREFPLEGEPADGRRPGEYTANGLGGDDSPGADQSDIQHDRGDGEEIRPPTVTSLVSPTVTGLDLTRTLRAVWPAGHRLTGPARELNTIARRTS